MWLASAPFRRAGIDTPSAWPVAEVFTLSLTVAAARAADPGRLTPDRCLAALAVVTVVAAWATGLQIAAAAGIVAWLFDDGFVTSHAGVLHWATGTDAPTLALLVTAAVGSALLGRHLRSATPTARPDSDPNSDPNSDPTYDPTLEMFRG